MPWYQSKSVRSMDKGKGIMGSVGMAKCVELGV